MRYLELTLDDPAMNLALDEALLETAESLAAGHAEGASLAADSGAGAASSEILRVWEPATPCVVLGRSSRIDQEVRLLECESRGIPVLRRASGGATIVTGPGCLMYAVLLSYQRMPELRLLDQAHQHVMERQREAVSRLGFECAVQGICDLTWSGRKFSGNSLRCRRHFVRYHGTLLYDFPVELLAHCLGAPERQPDYREQRSHLDFVTNLPAHRADLISSLRTVWGADEPTGDWPLGMTLRLASDKYSRLEWTKRH
ncbi:MAG: biotin/lipoate A/B protein ligase family protein [Planctomycetota bacterium]